jgi:hypothetical protein
MFYLRQIDGGHRINFDPQQLTAKRLLIGGTPFRKIVSLMTFDPPRDKWLPLLVDFRADGADVKLGSQAVSAKGATEINGTNTLVLRPGVKLRKVKLEAGEPKP